MNGCRHRIHPAESCAHFGAQLCRCGESLPKTCTTSLHVSVGPVGRKSCSSMKIELDTWQNSHVDCMHTNLPCGLKTPPIKPATDPAVHHLLHMRTSLEHSMTKLQRTVAQKGR